SISQDFFIPSDHTQCQRPHSLPHEKRNKSDSRLLSVPPHYGKISGKSSTLWKNPRSVAPFFPHNGTTLSPLFHAMEQL
ncbi:MAG: hypothetical protein KBF08_00785, partial [Kiritimatiellae bacterium]|nr:hypothetical protein [Kiritimatiellia bacterium]